MTTDIEKLKALASQIAEMPTVHGRGSFGKRADFDHYAEGHEEARKEAAKLILELAAGAAYQSSNTSETASARLAPKGAETRMDTSFCAGASSAPAAGTEKDAVQRVEKRIHAIWEDATIEWGDSFGGPPAYEIFARRLISAMQGEIDAAIAAHTKAGEPQL